MAEFSRFSIRLYYHVRIQRDLTQQEKNEITLWLIDKSNKGKYYGTYGDDVDRTPYFSFTNKNTAFAFKMRFG